MRGSGFRVGATVTLSVCAVVAVMIARGAAETHPTGDMAVLESYVIHASHGRLLVGPYSRFQWHHPGPIYLYMLVPFYTAGGHQGVALGAGALVLNLSMLLLAVAIAWGSGGALLSVCVAGALTLYEARAGGLITSAWNPHVVVLAVLVVALASASAAAGSVWLLPVAGLVASFAAQTHAGTLPASALLGALALAIVLLTSRPHGAPTPWSALLATLLVVAAAWVPSGIEQATHSPGNMTSLWTFFTSASGGNQPFHTAFVAWAYMLGGVFRADFHLAHGDLLRPRHDAVTQGIAIAQMLLLAAVAAASFRSPRRFDFFLPLFLLLASLLSLGLVTRIAGDIMDHEIFWLSALGALNTAVVAAGILSLVVREARGTPIPALAVCGTLLFICALAGLSELAGIRSRSRAPDARGEAIERASDGIRQYLLRQGTDRPFVDIDQDSWALAAGVLLQLQKVGVRYSVDDDWVPMFTDLARTTGQERVALSIAGARRHELIRDQPGVISVIAAGPVYVDAYGNPSATDAATAQHNAPITK